MSIWCRCVKDLNKEWRLIAAVETSLPSYILSFCFMQGLRGYLTINNSFFHLLISNFRVLTISKVNPTQFWTQSWLCPQYIISWLPKLHTTYQLESNKQLFTFSNWMIDYLYNIPSSLSKNPLTFITLNQALQYPSSSDPLLIKASRRR